MLKIIKDSTLVPTPIVDLKLDSEPRQGSTDPVTSEGVKTAIDGAVSDASEALQQQIDEIAEKAGSGYTPKGEATVATLNALSGQENGELYTITDAGTLTDGSLAVNAGDSVAWDATNEVWYKAMDYAPRRYGTNEVHNLPTTITAFRTGDVIPVDGPDGTAKMSKDDLLAITYNNALSFCASVIDCHNFPLCGGMIQDNGVYHQNTWYQGILIPAKEFTGKYIKLIRNASTSAIKFAFLKDSVLSDGSTANFCDGCSLYSTAIIYYAQIPSDCNYIYLYVYNREASPQYFYPSLSVVERNILIEYQSLLNDTAYISWDKIGVSNGYINHTTNEYINSSSYRGCFIPAKFLLGKKLILSRYNGANIRLAFLKNGFLINGETPAFSDSLNGVNVYTSSLEINIPDDCEYIYLYAFSTGNDVMPRILCGDPVKELDNKRKSFARLKIAEFNVGGFGNGQSFIDPSVDTLKDLRHFIADNAPDIFVPCETGTLSNWRKFMAMNFNCWFNFLSGWGLYDVMPCLQCSGDVNHVDLKLKLDPSNPSSAVRNSRMFELYVKGYRVAVVPVHFFPVSVYVSAGIDIDGVKASFDDWFAQISEADYDAVLICGDTNIKWDVNDQGTYNIDLINYFVNKGYKYVNGGSKSPSVDADFAQNFSEITYTPSPCVIDQLLIKVNNSNLRVCASYKVLTSLEMQAKYPYLYEATKNDHLPSIYDVYFG